jgi:predicted nuclease with RNAse H fold
LIAIRRAAQAARDTAVRTGTAIIVWRNGQVVRISANELQQTRTK